MTDVCYVLGGGSAWQDNEIRYSLRSIEKHLKNVRNIYIVGNLPKFLQDVQHIPMEDPHRNKEINIYHKVLRACQEESISDRFLFFNDDHFLNKDYDADTFPDFYKGYIGVMLRRAKKAPKGYKQIVQRTYSTLRALNLKDKYFDIHTPILYDKKLFLEKMTMYDWTHALGFVVKSMYGNTLGLEGVFQQDYKLNLKNLPLEEIRKLIGEAPIWSMSGDAPREEVVEIFQELYPNPSRWERF
jgi:hypothetical protein